VVTTLHAGSYDELPLAYDALLAWSHERGHRPAGPIRETYLPGPTPVTRVSVPFT
jgi:effector-binding domain-containing protein